MPENPVEDKPDLDAASGPEEGRIAESLRAGRAIAIAKILFEAQPGEKAEARRMDMGGSRVFWRLAASLKLPRSQEAGWLRFTRAVALLNPAAKPKAVKDQEDDGDEESLLIPADKMTSIHNPKRRLGAVLADGGQPRGALKLEEAFFSETRLAVLLAARGEARAEALERAIRMLARKQPQLNVVDLAHAFLDEGDARESFMPIARAYYARFEYASLKDAQND